MTVDNLTLDQLDVIFTKLGAYWERVPPLDMTVEKIKQVIFKYLGVKERKGDKIDLSNVPSAKGTEEEIRAWTKTGMKGRFQDFVRKYRKERRK